jgi:hypothetical protein
LPRVLRTVREIPGLTTALERNFLGLVDPRAVLQTVAKTLFKKTLSGLNVPLAGGPFIFTMGTRKESASHQSALIHAQVFVNNYTGSRRPRLTSVPLRKGTERPKPRRLGGRRAPRLPAFEGRPAQPRWQRWPSPERLSTPTSHATTPLRSWRRGRSVPKQRSSATSPALLFWDLAGEAAELSRVARLVTGKSRARRLSARCVCVCFCMRPRVKS